MPDLLSIVIPVYNEAVRLGPNLEAVERYLTACPLVDAFEIVCSDDGSTDGSAELADAAADRGHVRVVRAPKNEGKGAAVVRGMLAARGDPIFFFDADLSTPLEEIERFLQVVRDQAADVVIGTRKHPSAQIEKPQPWHRVQLGLAYTRLVHVMTGTRFTDYTCGFKCFRARARDEIFRRSVIRGWSFDAELLFLARLLDYRVEEVPVRWADEPDSRVRLASAMIESFAELVRIRMNQMRGRYR